MEKSEFLLSTLEGALERSTSFSSISYATSAVLSIVIIMLALIQIAPEFKLWFLLLTFGAMIVFMILLTPLFRLSRIKKRWLRRWQLQVFLSSASVNWLSQDSIVRLIELIHELEDHEHMQRDFYEQHDHEFMEILTVSEPHQ